MFGARKYVNTTAISNFPKLIMTDINKKLEVLYDILIDDLEAFENDLKELILMPQQIADTNKLTWLISEFINKPVFIKPFIDYY